MTDKKELAYITRIGELTRACGLMLGILEGLILDSRISIVTKMNAKKILIEARELIKKK